MDEHYIDFKVFLRNFVNRIPKDRNRTLPLIKIEFEDAEVPGDVSDPIYLYRIESLNILHYKYRDQGSTHTWSVPGGSYAVVSIRAPKHKKSILPRSIDEVLGIIRVRHGI